MKRWLVFFVVGVVVSACSASKPPTTPTVATCTDRNASNFGSPGACVYPPPPPPLLSPSFTVSDAVIDCVRGLCFGMNAILTNNGPGCANSVQVLIRWYGADGAVVLPNTPDVIMGATGGLNTYYFGARTSLAIFNVASFNDVRSAHTVYRSFVTYNTVACR